MDKKIVFILFISTFIHKSVGLRCYVCSFSATDTDRSCLDITDDTQTVNCPSTYCTILRQEFVDPAGEISSFYRGCEEAPDYLNHDIVDSYFHTYYRACTTDFCNIGNGIATVVGGSLSPRPLQVGQNLLVPGTAGASNIFVSFVTILTCTLMSTILFN